MKAIIPYLTFDGRCREAMTFYSNALGAELQLMPFADMPDGPTATPDRIMHARFSHGAATLMASDSMPGTSQQQGNNFSISVGCESNDEVDRLYTALSEGGSRTMPPEDTFWGAYFGMLKDKFGIQWMFNYDKPR